jgi:hypothetical protein
VGNVLGKPETRAQTHLNSESDNMSPPWFFGYCCAYLTESGASFQNIDSEPVHGEKVQYVQIVR